MSTDTIIIHQANHDDYRTISALGCKTFTQTFGHLFDESALASYLEQTFNEEKIRLSLAKAQNHFALMYDESTPIGYLKLKRDSSHDAIQAPQQYQLQKLYVDQEYIGKQIGARAMRYVIAQCTSRTPLSLWLAVVHGNDRAKAFYERNHFRVMGQDTHTFDVGTMNFHIMARDVA